MQVNAWAFRTLEHSIIGEYEHRKTRRSTVQGALWKMHVAMLIRRHGAGVSRRVNVSGRAHGRRVIRIKGDLDRLVSQVGLHMISLPFKLFLCAADSRQ